MPKIRFQSLGVTYLVAPDARRHVLQGFLHGVRPLRGRRDPIGVQRDIGGGVRAGGRLPMTFRLP